MHECKFCGKEFGTAGARAGHEGRSHIRRTQQKVNGAKGHQTQVERNLLRKVGEFKHKEETRDKLSLIACERIAKHSKYTKNVEYAPGVILESSYEVRLAKILDELNIEWVRVRRGYEWNDNGRKRRYIPDFYLPRQDIFLDPKNDYLIKRDKRKIDSAMQINNINVLVLSDKQINTDYIKNTLL